MLLATVFKQSLHIVVI